MLAHACKLVNVRGHLPGKQANDGMYDSCTQRDICCLIAMASSQRTQQHAYRAAAEAKTALC